MDDSLVMGIDFGTDSVRVLIADPVSGTEISQAVCRYPRWNDGKFCSPGSNMFRQHPSDYIESFESCAAEALEKAGPETGKRIAGITVDTTGSTPCAVDRTGTPLALNEKFKDNPDAMFILWKDHTAIEEAQEITGLAKSWGGEDYTRYSGGDYSPEWFWAKILHTIRTNPEIGEEAWTWVEHSDWMPFFLTGGTEASGIKRSRCTAGHKAMWHESWNGLPSKDFLASLDPVLGTLRERLYTDTFTVDIPAGRISGYWASRLGINPGAVVGTGALDAHIGAVGGGIEPGTLIKVVGTSTCDMIVTDGKGTPPEPVKGISGQVDGSIIPGYTGFEAGQSAFGDIYAWFENLLAWSPDKSRSEKGEILKALETEASKLPVNPGLLALDWFNGRRTPDGNPGMTGTITGIRLGDSAPRIYRTLVEATAFGSRAILDRFVDSGINIQKIVAVGGIAKKSELVMQVLSDVLNREIEIPESEQTVAAGAAMCASVVCGIHKDIPSAQKAMKQKISRKFTPDPEKSGIYARMYKDYLKLGSLMENFKEG